MIHMSKTKIWNYFIEKIGNAYGVAGLMGNLQAESNFQCNNLENSYEDRLGFTDETYTTAVDNGTYSKNSFVNDNAGYGLAQWTYYTRKQALYEMYKSGGYSSISSVDLACDYLWYELQNDFSGVLSVLKSATSISQASNKVLFDFENPADQSESVQAYRLELSTAIYNELKNNTGNTYTPRLDETGLSSNKWYNSPLNPFAVAGFGLPNCTCYAWGRRGEITGEQPNTSLGDAFTWWQYNIDNNVYPYGQTAKLGAIICWDYGTGLGGHVAIVEKINSDGSIVTSNSAYSGTYFYTQTLTKESNYCWREGLIFQGFIYLNEDYESGDITPDPPTPTNKNKKLSKLLLYAIGSGLF